jgi:SAM-dependent methyltransferase
MKPFSRLDVLDVSTMPYWNRINRERLVDLDLLAFCFSCRDCDRSLLDVGCGEGRFMQLASRKGMRVLGLDNNEQFIGKCSDEGLPVISHDISNPFPVSPGWDVVAGMYSIYYNDEVSILNHMRAVLGPGGRLVIVGPTELTNREYLHAWNLHLGPVPEFFLKLYDSQRHVVLPYLSSLEGSIRTMAITANIRFDDWNDVDRYTRSSAFYKAARDPEALVHAMHSTYNLPLSVTKDSMVIVWEGP